MKTNSLVALVFLSIVLAGCQQFPERAAAITPVNQPEKPLAASLFPSDQAVLADDAVARILATKLELPAKAKLAILKFPDVGRYSWHDYWRDEEYLKLQQTQVDALTAELTASEQISGATVLPSLMTPQQMSIPVLREAALRMQADLLLIFRVGTDTYSQYRVFAKDKARAYSTCEVVLLDIRTGLVPFTRVLGREHLETQQKEDLDLGETRRRAEQAASADALKAAAQDLVAYIKSVPRKNY